jgi:hypothetical protein
VTSCWYPVPIVVVVVQDRESAAPPSGLPGGAGTGAGTSKVVTLPVCFLDACAAEGDNCPSQINRKLETSLKRGMPYATILEGGLKGAARIYWVRLRISVDRVGTLAGTWGEFGCVSLNDDDNDEATTRRRRCLQEIPRWTDMTINNRMIDVTNNEDYKRICLRQSS